MSGVMEAIKALALNDGDVIVIRGDAMGLEETEQLRSFLVATDRSHCLVIELLPGTDLDVLTAEQMREHGWVRIT